MNSRGIGYPTAQQLANHGATVYLAVRDPAKGKAAAEQMELEAVAAGLKDRVGQIKVLELDLTSVVQTKEAAEKFMQLETRLDILGELHRLGRHCVLTTPSSEQCWDVSILLPSLGNIASLMALFQDWRWLASHQRWNRTRHRCQVSLPIPSYLVNVDLNDI